VQVFKQQSELQKWEIKEPHADALPLEQSLQRGEAFGELPIDVTEARNCTVCEVRFGWNRMKRKQDSPKSERPRCRRRRSLSSPPRRDTRLWHTGSHEHSSARSTASRAALQSFHARTFGGRFRV